MTILLFWSVTALEFVTAVLLQQRSNAVHAYYQTGSTELVATALQRADDERAISNLTLTVVFAGALTLVTWTYFLALNARDRGVPAVEPARSAGLWLIPLFGGAVVMKRLGRLVEAFDYSAHRLTQWRYLFYANLPLFVLMTFAVGTGFSQQYDIESSGRALDREVIVQYVTAVVFVVSAFVASRAILHADRSISGRRRNGSARPT